MKANNAASWPLNAPTARQRRQLLEQALERLLAAAQAVIDDLDAIDGDPDFEPSLGLTDARDQRYAAAGARDDREWMCEDEGHDSDTELNGDERDEDYAPVPFGGLGPFIDGVKNIHMTFGVGTDYIRP